ncbi:endonuclease/exonuclease/phosphatase family protein [Streptomyces sp. bgisy060]|uniref:endonuclease/exonuclease/phosphatase family protein n=1 Tax=Streptomyces sp. bgisy060 TaxID=3413775 RepID=UPI003EBDAD18
MTALRVLVWNVMKGEHLAKAGAYVAAVRPDVWLAQEILPRHVAPFELATDMRCYPAAPATTSPNDNAIFVRPGGRFEVAEEYAHPDGAWHPPANLAVRDAACREEPGGRRVSLVSHHLCYFSADRRLAEAAWCTTLAKPGWLAIIGGDWNSYPSDAGPAASLWASLLADGNPSRDRALYVNRTFEERGTRHTDDRPDRLLRAAGFVDAARYARDELGQDLAMDPTTGHGDLDRQGGRWRIDRVYVSQELAPAITDVQVGDASTVGALSDHLPVLLTLDSDKVRALVRPHTSLTARAN